VEALAQLGQAAVRERFAVDVEAGAGGEGVGHANAPEWVGEGRGKHAFEPIYYAANAVAPPVRAPVRSPPAWPAGAAGSPTCCRQAAATAPPSAAPRAAPRGSPRPPPAAPGNAGCLAPSPAAATGSRCPRT